MEYSINFISEKEVAFYIGWNNLNKEMKKILKQVTKEKRPVIKDIKILEELDMLEIINKEGVSNIIEFKTRALYMRVPKNIDSIE